MNTIKKEQLAINEAILSRRHFLKYALASVPVLTGGLGSLSYAQSEQSMSESPADLIVINGKIATLAQGKPYAQAVAVRHGLFTAVGDNKEVMQQRGPQTQVIDANNRTSLPAGLKSPMPLAFEARAAGKEPVIELDRRAAIAPMEPAKPRIQPICPPLKPSPPCSGGACSISCSSGWTDCSADENASRDGCETNTDADEANCGDCDIVCDDDPEHSGEKILEAIQMAWIDERE